MITRRRFTQIAAIGSLGLAGGTRASEPRATAKKGCCLVARDGTDWLGKIERLQPSWMYTWGPNRPAELDPSIDFTPMLWGDAQPARQAKRIADLKERASAGEISHLLAFNEPDQHEQANMQVRRGLELWPDLMEVGVPLVSPGCVHPDGVWMHGFMEEVARQSLRV
ncbi:MAG: glycosyl hydrolase, partial [Planctomycetota bacterium]